MEFTGNTIKTGQSVIGDFKLDYSISYNEENKVTRLEAQIKKITESINRPIGSISYAEKRYSFSLMETTTADERQALFADFENTLVEVS